MTEDISMRRAAFTLAAILYAVAAWTVWAHLLTSTATAMDRDPVRITRAISVKGWPCPEDAALVGSGDYRGKGKGWTRYACIPVDDMTAGRYPYTKEVAR